jgi:hypothetical protein
MRMDNSFKELYHKGKEKYGMVAGKGSEVKKMPFILLIIFYTFHFEISLDLKNCKDSMDFLYFSHSASWNVNIVIVYLSKLRNL